MAAYRLSLVLMALLAMILAGCGGGINTMDAIGDSGLGGSVDTASLRQTGANPADSFWDLQILKQTPESEVMAESVDTTPAGEVVVREISYRSPAAGDEELEIFAYYAVPTSKGTARLPAIVWVHGGGSVSSRQAVVEWASRGYAAISMDLPGKGGPDREASRSQGPDMIDANIFSVKPSPKSSYLYLCVNAVCRAISWLGAQREVDSGRIGVLGYSWGGVITLLVNGIDSRVAAACTVYGAGHIPDDSYWAADLSKLARSDVDAWRLHYDPASYSQSMHGSTLFVGATEDRFYSLASMVKTYESAACIKAVCLAPNRDHEMDDICTANVARWFDWALRSGPRFADFRTRTGGGRLTVSCDSERPLCDVRLHVRSEAGKWTATELSQSDGGWSCALPAEGKSWFVSATDANGATTAGGFFLMPDR